MRAQTIPIDSTFNTSCEIFPFGEIEKITSLTLSGDIELNSDTSLVRIIYIPYDENEFMIFEAYSLIVTDLSFSVREECDETCFLNVSRPYSIKIQIIDAELTLNSLNYYYEEIENTNELQFSSKRSADAQKIETINERIGYYKMNWEAADNNIVAMYYYQKKEMFGDAYNLQGFDYYSKGVFEFLGHRNYPKVNPDLVKYFDWRNRHGANNSQSPYWDGDTLGTGWFTSVKAQKKLTCWAYSAAGLTEAIANLYTNEHLDLDLSEQDLISCSGVGDCDGGYDNLALVYVRDLGIVSELCFPVDPRDCPGINFDSCDNKCTNPEITIKINDTIKILDENHDSIRLALINYGPMSIAYKHGDTALHAVNLIGYEFDNSDSTSTWIIKNSWGLGWGINGMGKIKIPIIRWATGIKTPVYLNDTALQANCQDLDGDGYYFWGIGEKPGNCNCSDIEDCDDNNPFVGGYDENYYCSCIFEMDSVSHHVSSNTNWVDSTYVNYIVMIDSGACLTISSYAAFAPQAKIVVRQGAKLIIDGGYLTKACPELWRGIEVLGSDTIQSFDEYFGKVVLQNNAIIEFAKIGIANHCTLCDYNFMQSGGMISAQNSIFRDNERDILLAPFRSYWFGHDLPYACVISDCRFITTDYFYPDHVPQAHIEMKDIYGVMIYGCRFENQSDLEYYPLPIRGMGISSIDSYFMINRYCLTPGISPCEDFDTCKFSRLEYGIKALNSHSKRTLNIQGLQFDDNFAAISLSGLQYASILSNNFKCPKRIKELPANRFTGGLFMEGCTGYHVENNKFDTKLTNLESGKSPCFGIGVKNSGPENNEIYNNVFQKFNTGIISIGENRGRESGLCLKCNDMVNNTNDFIVVKDDRMSSGIQGINLYQGDPVDSTSWSAPAGNTFTMTMDNADSLLIEYYNYFNSAENIRYTHHAENVNYLLHPLDSNYSSETIELKGWFDLQYVKETACPSGLGGGGSLKSYSSPRSMINEADIQVDILKTQLNALVDGGNTEALNFEVLTSMPDEGFEIREQLLSESPYLSDTVLKQAIYKEDVLPNAMIRDIMEANPQSAKSNEILISLDSRYEPMPDYMMAQIMQGKKYLGAKEVLEANIQSWSQIRSKAKADLMREFLLDTNMISPLDSVILFLENEIDMGSRYDLALAQWNNFDLVGAWETLNTIPSQFTFSESQSIYHDNYLDYYGVLQTLADSNWKADQLDSISVSLLIDLKDTGNPGIAALARGLLVKGGFFKYIETVNLPELTKSSRIQPEQYPLKNTDIKEEKLWLFPNPAGDYVIAYYDLDPIYKSGEIHLIDLKGNLLRSYYIRCGKDQMVIDLKDYPNGFYMISLNSRNKVLDSKKLIKGSK